MSKIFPKISDRFLKKIIPQFSNARLIWCLYPEWWEMWNLGDIDQPFPQVSGKTNSDLGDRVNKAFKRYGFSHPYNLRHAWAIRAIGFIPVELAAPMMDHSVLEHIRT
ncbi:MAG: hypothetical protein ACRC80_17880, partial [Waterburya sp.]